MRGLSSSRRPVALRVAAIWLLAVSLIDAHDHQTAPGQMSNMTIPTVASKASASEGEQDHVVGPPSPAQTAPRLEVGVAERQPPLSAEAAVAAEGRGSPPGDAAFPSPRCAKREEWKDPCRIWSGKPHHRYLVFDEMNSDEGIGASLNRVAWALDHAMAFDLEPVINGPLLATHGTGDFGDWVGLTHNPLLAIQDPAGFQRAKNQTVPFPQGHRVAYWSRRQHRTSVVYTADPMKVEKVDGWGIPVFPPSSDARVCKYVRQAMRDIYWSVPQNRGRCRGLLPEDHYTPPVLPEYHNTPREAVVDAVDSTSGSRWERTRPWVVAVHVRRGDILRYRPEKRSVPHSYFQATVTSVLRAIAASDPETHVSVLVFSEGPERLKGLQLFDENGKPVTWDIQHESCLDIGIHCSQKVLLRTSAFQTFDCLAAADVVIGSRRSAFSDAVAALSTNVGVLLRADQKEQDQVTLDDKAVASLGAVDSNMQQRINTAIADWWYCSREAQQATGSDAKSISARRFYQTVDEVLSSP